VVDRSGYCYPLFPLGTASDRSYQLWREEVAGPVTAVCTGKDVYDGVDTLVFSFSISPAEKREANPAIVEKLGLPREIGFAQLAEELTRAGVDMQGMLERLAVLASPQDLEALQLARGKALPVKYYLSGETEIAVQPRLGVTVDIRRDTERISLEADPAPLMDLFFIMSKYSSDPVVGRDLQRLTSLQASLGQPQVVFEFTFGASRDTVDEALSLIRDTLRKARILEAAPWFSLVLGALLLGSGLVLCRTRPSPKRGG
jgi:Porin PorA